MSVARQDGAPLVSGGCDGELRAWNLQLLESGGSVPKAHEGFVRDVVVSPDGRRVLSCGDDKAARMWTLNARQSSLVNEPEASYSTAAIPNSIDHHWAKPMFVTAGDTVDVWDYQRSAPLSSFEWGCERVIASRFNPAEPALITFRMAELPRRSYRPMERSTAVEA